MLGDIDRSARPGKSLAKSLEFTYIRTPQRLRSAENLTPDAVRRPRKSALIPQISALRARHANCSEVSAPVYVPFAFARQRQRLSRLRRGFTLVELMVVVLIVAILAAIAVPSVLERMRERRSAEAAQRIASLYRGARMRAMGRGSAVMVSFDKGAFVVREAVRPPPETNTECTGEPSSSCVNTNWTDGKSFAELSRFEPTKRSEYEGLTLAPVPSTATRLDICFTPMGRAYTRSDDLPFSTPMVQVASFNVGRSGSVLTRTVMVLPNGVARLAL